MATATNDHTEVADRLRDHFPIVAPAVIQERVDAAFASLATAPIQSFTPILVQRSVRQQLLGLAAP